jgi:hypothetical protein
MSKLKNIIKQLSPKDFSSIYDSLMESNAEKSAYLLKFLREKQLSDAKIMEQLEVNPNAYYTLRSRLNQKIEEYLLQQMESPRTTLLKKVATVNEILFTKKKGIAIAALRKLEKELLDYDLSNELTIVYKTLKKLHIHTPEHFNYSQLYNRHVAYMLALDKAEDLLAEYFKKYGNYFLSSDETEKMGLDLLKKELDNVANLYQSHRLYVYQNCVHIFHKLYVAPEKADENEEGIDIIFEKMQSIFDSYYLDSIYYHLKLLFEFLKLEYYKNINQRKAEKHYDEVNDEAATLLTNYSLYTFTPQLLLTKLEKNLSANTEGNLNEENKIIFEDFEIDKNNIPLYVIYVSYRAISAYYSDKYEEAAKWIHNLLNDLSLKKFPQTQLELKIFLAMQYSLRGGDYEVLFNQLINSIQRQIRLMGKDNCQHILVFTKMLKTSLHDTKKSKALKIQGYINKMKKINPPHFSLLKYIKLDEDFIVRLS